MRVPKNWILGSVVVLTACGGSSPAFCAVSARTELRAEREAPGALRNVEFGEHELDMADKPSSQRWTRDGDTAGPWWVSAKESVASAKR